MDCSEGEENTTLMEFIYDLSDIQVDRKTSFNKCALVCIWYEKNEMIYESSTLLKLVPFELENYSHNILKRWMKIWVIVISILKILFAIFLDILKNCASESSRCGIKIP